MTRRFQSWPFSLKCRRRRGESTLISDAPVRYCKPRTMLLPEMSQVSYRALAWRFHKRRWIAPLRSLPPTKKQNRRYNIRAMELFRPPISDERIWITKWVVADGAMVKEDEIICEFESAKATLDYPAPCDGILHHLAKPMDRLGWMQGFARIDPQSSD